MNATQHAQLISTFDEQAEAAGEAHRQRAELARLKARVSQLENLLSEWARTFPDLGDTHDKHTRGHYYTSTCPGCRAEWEMLKVADEIHPNLIKAQVLP